jgi:4-amino-4-deoxy-L-arabinose transferase-like glycosyltransferase
MTALRRFIPWVVIGVPALLFAVRDASFFPQAVSSVPDFSVLFDHFVLTPLVLTVWLTLAFGAGSNFLRHVFRLVDLGFAEEIVLAVPIGLGLFSLAVLVLGLCGVLNAGVFAGLGLFLAVLFQERIRYLWRSAFGAAKRVRSEGWGTLVGEPLNFAEALSLGLLLWTAWHGWIQAMAPPIDGDSIAYHLAHPQDYLREGRIFYHPGNLWGCFPGNLEMQYLLALLLKGEALAQSIPWVFSLLLPLSVFLFGKRFFGSRTVGILGAAALSVQPVATAFLGTAMQDGAAALLVFTAAYAFFRFLENGEARWMGVSGCFLGLAAGTKYSALPFAAVLSVLFAAVAAVRSRFGVRAFSLFLLSAGFFCGAWFVRNAYWTGNPVWPLMQGVFAGRDLNPDQAAVLSQIEIQPGQERTVAGWLKLPWRMTSEFRFGHYYNPEYLTWPLILLLGLALFFRKRPPGAVWFFGSLAVLGSIFLFSTVSFWRYFLPALPGLCLILAWAAEAVPFPRRAASLALAALLSVAALRLTQVPALFPALGLRSPGGAFGTPRESYLSARLPHYAVYQWGDGNLPADARVLLVEHSDAYHLRRRWLASDPLYQGLIRYPELQTVDDLSRRLSELGVTHVFYNAGGKVVVSDRDRALLPEWYWRGEELLSRWMAERCTLIKESGGYRFYECRRNP